jgi:hypothetical protein
LADASSLARELAEELLAAGGEDLIPVGSAAG